MANSQRAKPVKRKTLNYFYLDGNLHKKLHINLPADQIRAWCYPLGKRVTLTYSDVKRRMEPAFTTVEAGKMLNRGRLALERAILEGNITAPQFTYGLNEHRRKFKYMWAEKNILEAHAHLSQLHWGRPRNDGLVTPKPMPTAREIRAMIRQDEPLYVRNGKTGEFEPVWRADYI